MVILLLEVVRLHEVAGIFCTEEMNTHSKNRKAFVKFYQYEGRSQEAKTHVKLENNFVILPLVMVSIRKQGKRQETTF